MSKDFSIAIRLRSGDRSCYFVIGNFTIFSSWSLRLEDAYRFPDLKAAESWANLLLSSLSSVDSLTPIPDRLHFPLSTGFRLEYLPLRLPAGNQLK